MAANDELTSELKKTALGGGNTFTRIPVGKKQVDKKNALLSKYVRSAYGQVDAVKGELAAPQQAAMRIAGRTASNVIDGESMMQLLPDMELAKQVLISSVLSPNDMMSTRLGYRTVNDDLGEITPMLLEVVQTYFDNVYKINKQLPKMLEDILFTRGAYPICVIPEAAIDDLINGSKRVAMEGIADYYDTGKRSAKGLGILGGPQDGDTGFSFGLESLHSTPKDIDAYIRPNYDAGNPLSAKDFGISVTDNISVLKFPKLHKRMVNDKIRDTYAARTISLESDDKNTNSLTEREVDDLLSNVGRRQFSYTPVVSVKTLKELGTETKGHPLVLNLPTECVIPVHVPSAPEQHIGYFIVVDQYGNPVRADLTKDYFNDMSSNTNGLRDMSSMLISQTKRSTDGAPDNMDVRIIEEMQLAFNQVVERNMRNRLRNGVYGDNVEVSDLDEVNRTMFSRALARKTTQLVYVPMQLMVYMAIDYNAYGVGKSLLEATKIIGALRSMLMFANTMAATKNSINHTDVNIELDPKDPNPMATLEYMRANFARTRSSSFPIGASNPQDQVDYLANAGVQFNISGHPGMPETKSTVEQKQVNNVKPDTELEESLKKRHLMAVYVPPETVDLSMSVDFAKSVISSNLLLAKRAMIIQQTFSEFLSEFIRKFVFNSQKLVDKLKEIIVSNKDEVLALKNTKYTPDDILLYFINSIEVFLPEPEISRMEVQKQSFDAYSEFIDASIEAYVSTAQFDSSIFGDMSNTIETTKAVLKAQLQRQFMATNNIMPEMAKMFSVNDKDGAGHDLLAAHTKYMEDLGKNMLPFMEAALKAAADKNAKLAKATEEAGATGGDAGGEGGGDTGGEGGDTGGEGGDEGGEGGDLGLDEVSDDVGGGDADGEAATGDDAEEKEPEAEEPAAEEKPAEDDAAAKKDDEDKAAKEKEEADKAKAEEDKK